MTSPDLTPTPAVGEPDELGWYAYSGGAQVMIFHLRRGGQWSVHLDNGTSADCAWGYIEQALGVWDLVPLTGLLAAYPLPSDTEEERKGDVVAVELSDAERKALRTSGSWPFVGTDIFRAVEQIIGQRLAAQPSVPAPVAEPIDMGFMSLPVEVQDALTAPAPAAERCPESWVPTAGGPGHQCVKPAGHDGAHDSAPAPEGVTCEHPLGFTALRMEVLTCPDCKAPCPGPCVCGAPFRSMVCMLNAHLRGPALAAPAPVPEDEQREAPDLIIEALSWQEDLDSGRWGYDKASQLLREHDAQVRDNERQAWADWLSNWLGAVGPMPPTAEDVLAWLRHEQRPFGVFKNREAGEGR